MKRAVLSRTESEKELAIAAPRGPQPTSRRRSDEREGPARIKSPPQPGGQKQSRQTRPRKATMADGLIFASDKPAGDRFGIGAWRKPMPRAGPIPNRDST